VGGILVHEFATLDGVIESPTWTFEFGFDPQMGQSIKELTDRSRAIGQPFANRCLCPLRRRPVRQLLACELSQAIKPALEELRCERRDEGGQVPLGIVDLVHVAAIVSNAAGSPLADVPQPG